ncbi:MAG: hypothetical protein BMS9Abin20_0052 [Acidimicrobiia bacterium]|nr:MAG: hypothetical protein BMS9Abin20_0052 [Acidimicrobiia bacterium]
MSMRFRFARRRWWRKQFHPLTRFGWMTATAGKSRSTTQTIVGLGLVGAGFILKGTGRKKVLYKGTITPGTDTRIRVYRGSDIIHDELSGD